MTTRVFAKLIAAASCAALVSAAGAAFAQAPTATAPAAAAPAAATPLPAGPAIPGVCVFSSEAAIGSSAVGKYVGSRLQQLQSQVQAELQGQETSLQNDAKALEAQRASLGQDQLQQRALTLQQRQNSLQRTAQIRDRELEATQQKALGRVMTEINPLLRQVYAQKQCSLLLDGNAVLGSNPAMNITADVVRLLDAKITQFPFERERLEQQAAAPAAAPARK
jgi:outer membrane protein